jgi:sugar/nucleoside kinase (ribokinase family)
MVTGTFIGLSTMDCINLVDEFPNEDSKVLSSQSGIFAGGPALNAAITFSILGGHANLVSLVGRSGSRSSLIKEELDRYSVDLIDLADAEFEPPLASIISAKRSSSRTIVTSEISDDYHEFTHHNLIGSSDIALWDQHYPASMSGVAESFRGLSEIVLDAGSLRSQSQFAVDISDHIIGSQKFEQQLIERYGISEINSHHEKSSWIITRGPDDITVKEGGLTHSVSPRTVDAVDTLGAGDIFHGAFCYYKASGYNVMDSVKRAMFTASESTRVFGTRDGIKPI